MSADKLLAEAAEVGGVQGRGGRGARRPTPTRCGNLIDQLRRKASPVAVLLASREDEGKVMLVAGISRDLVERGLDAGNWIRGAAEVVGGSGGGRPDMAQAGGKHPEKLPEALETRARPRPPCWAASSRFSVARAAAPPDSARPARLSPAN